MTAHRFDTTARSLDEQAGTRLRRPAPDSRPAPAAPAPPQLVHGSTMRRSAQVLAYVELIHALCELDRVDRAALRLIYWQGRTQAQVAEELHLPIGAVRAGVARGMRQLAGRLADQSSPPACHRPGMPSSTRG